MDMQPSPADVYQQLGEFVRNRREEIGVSRDDLAATVKSYGVDDFSSAHLYRLETGDKSAQKYLGDPELMKALSAALRVSVFQIFQDGNARRVP